MKQKVTLTTPMDDSDVNDTVLSGDSDAENDIVTDSESDDPEDWVAIKDLSLYSEEVKAK